MLSAGTVGRSISRYTLLVKVAVVKSFRACHFSKYILTHSCSTALSMMRKQCCSTVTAFYSDGSHILGPGFPGVCGILDTASLQVFPHPLAPKDDSLRARWRSLVFHRILRCRLAFGVTTRKTLTKLHGRHLSLHACRGVDNVSPCERLVAECHSPDDES